MALPPPVIAIYFLFAAPWRRSRHGRHGGSRGRVRSQRFLGGVRKFIGISDKKSHLPHLSVINVPLKVGIPVNRMPFLIFQ